MRLEKAYAEDIEKNITAQEADKLYKEGSIKSKFSFKCPDKSCHAPVTCANLDRPKNQRRRDPYYKFVGEHDSGCTIAVDINNLIKKTRRSEGLYSSRDHYIEQAIRLNLQPPSTKRPEPTDNSQAISDGATRVKQSNISNSDNRKIQRTKTLSSLIDAFLAGESHLVQLPEIGTIDIKDLFVEISGQDVSGLEDEFRIYYGKAWFNKKTGYYSVVYANELTLNNKTKRPTIYLSLEEFTKSGFKRFKLSELENAAGSKPRLVFLLSETGPRLKGEYINFWCEGPEYLDYRL